MRHLVGTALGEPPGLMIGAFMRVHGHPRIAVLARPSRNGVSTNLQQRFAIVVPMPLAKPPATDTTPPDGELRGETNVR